MFNIVIRTAKLGRRKQKIRKKPYKKSIAVKLQIVDYQTNTAVTKIKIYRGCLLYHKTLIINKFYHLMQKPNSKSEVNHYKSIICLIVYPIVSKNTFSQHPSQLSPTILSSLHFLPFSSMRLYFTILSPSLQQLLFHYHSPPHSSSPLPPILPLLSTSPPSTFTLFSSSPQHNHSFPP